MFMCLNNDSLKYKKSGFIVKIRIASAPPPGRSRIPTRGPEVDRAQVSQKRGLPSRYQSCGPLHLFNIV